MKSTPKVIDFSFVLASSVHDMKNSLGRLMNTVADVVENYPPQSASHAEAYAVLQYEAVRMNSDLIQLLSLYHLNQNQVHLRLDKYYVFDLLSDQIARNHSVLQSHKIQLELLCDKSLQGYFDNDLIGGVINNILVNCARYCKKSLRVSAHQEQDFLRIAIEDDGPGYPQEMLHSVTNSELGMSFAEGRPHLGLMFAQRAASMHHSKTQQGFIRLNNSSELGGGCFSLYLP